MNTSFGRVSVSSDIFGASGETPLAVVLAVPGEAVHLPPGFELTTAEFARSGSDLILTGADGGQIVVQNFYSFESLPDLISASGAVLPGQIAAQLSGPLAPAQLAQAAPAAGAEPIGTVETVTGEAIAVRADGTRETLDVGDQIFQGDVIETGVGAALGIVLADETTFSMAENGRIVMDELVYDPAVQSGKLSLSVITGVFVVVSGQIAKADPDAMVLTTPVATIGVRGTQLGVSYSEGTPLQVVLMEEQNGFVGELVVSNAAGTIILNQANQGTFVASANDAPSTPAILTASAVTEVFGFPLGFMPSNGNFNPYGVTPAFGDQGQGDAAPDSFETAAGEPTAQAIEFTAIGFSGITLGSTTIAPAPAPVIPSTPTPPTPIFGGDPSPIPTDNESSGGGNSPSNTPAPPPGPPPGMPTPSYTFVHPAAPVTTLYANPGVGGIVQTVSYLTVTVANATATGSGADDYLAVLDLGLGINTYFAINVTASDSDDIITVVQAIGASVTTVSVSDVTIDIQADLPSQIGNDLVDLHVSARLNHVAGGFPNNANVHNSILGIDVGEGNNVVSVTEQASAIVTAGPTATDAIAQALLSNNSITIEAAGLFVDSVDLTFVGDAHAATAGPSVVANATVKMSINDIAINLADGTNDADVAIIAHAMASGNSGTEVLAEIFITQTTVSYDGQSGKDTIDFTFAALAEATNTGGTQAIAAIHVVPSNDFTINAGDGTNTALVNWYFDASASANGNGVATANVSISDNSFTYFGGVDADIVTFNMFARATAYSSESGAYAQATDNRLNLINISLSTASHLSGFTEMNEAHVDFTAVAFAQGCSFAQATATVSNNTISIFGSNFVDQITVDLTAYAVATASTSASAAARLNSNTITIDTFDGPGDTVSVDLVAFGDSSLSISPVLGSAEADNNTINVIGGSGDDVVDISITADGNLSSEVLANSLMLKGKGGADTFSVTMHGGTVTGNSIDFEGGAGADHLTFTLTAGVSALSNTVTMQYNDVADIGDTLTLIGLTPNVKFEFLTSEFAAGTGLFLGGAGGTSDTFGYYSGALWYDPDGFNTGTTAVQVVAFDGNQPTLAYSDIAFV